MAKQGANNIGWIKIHRNMMHWMEEKSPSVVKVYLYILMSVNTRTQKFDWGVCRRGETFISQYTLSQKLHLSVNTIKKALRELEQGGEIEREVIDQNHIKIRVPKFSTYQIGGVSKNDTPTQMGVSKNDTRVYQKLTPNKNNINKNKGEDNIMRTRTNDEILQDLLNSQSLIEAHCMNEGITPEQFKGLAKAVVVEWSLTGEHYNTESETKMRMLAHIRTKAQAMNVQRASLEERKAKFIAECKALVDQGFNRGEVAEFANYYSQPTADGRLLFETFKGWNTLTRFQLNQKRKSS
jgi:DNA-binding Lrp family transcriptional regulator